MEIIVGVQQSISSLYALGRNRRFIQTVVTNGRTSFAYHKGISKTGVVQSMLEP